MGRMVLLLLSVLGVMGVSGQQSIRYVSDPLNWTAAQNYCRQHHIDLVTISTEAENDQINKDSWLGLYRDNSSADWKWSRGDKPLTFNNSWKNNPADDENCVYKHNGDKGPWKSMKCSDTNKFFCLDDSLFLVREMKTWEEALVHCRSLSSGQRRYDLASLITVEDHDFVKSQISDKVWTGLRFLGDRWVWVGGEDVQYGDINSCPESKRCGMVDKMTSGDYIIANCDEQRNFFCYRKS